MVVSLRSTARKIPWLHLAASLVGFVLLAAVSFSVLRPIVVLPRMAPAPSFGLLSDRNGWLLDSDLRGQIVLYNFTYTHCAGACPQTSQVLRAVQDRLAADGFADPVTLVTITFDTARDTPAALAAYAKRLGADPRRWRFATGSRDELKQLIGGGFKTYYAPNADGTYTFDPVFVLVDGEGMVRAKYRTAAPSIDTIMRDLRLIADEARNSRGAQRYAYEAAHLFVCYPR